MGQMRTVKEAKEFLATRYNNCKTAMNDILCSINKIFSSSDYHVFHYEDIILEYDNLLKSVGEIYGYITKYEYEIDYKDKQKSKFSIGSKIYVDTTFGATLGTISRLDTHEIKLNTDIFSLSTCFIGCDIWVTIDANNSNDVSNEDVFIYGADNIVTTQKYAVFSIDCINAFWKGLCSVEDME